VLDTKEDARVNDELDSDTEEEEDKDNGANVDKGLDSEDDDGEEDEDEEDECDYGHVYRNVSDARTVLIVVYTSTSVTEDHLVQICRLRNNRQDYWHSSTSRSVFQTFET
jgi:hypothetical protein